MTGFARAEAQGAGCAIAWELRSVNGRSLDIRMRLPQGLERIEPRARLALQQRFSRGSLSATLSVTRIDQMVPLRVNEPLLRMLAQIAMKLHREEGCAPPSADGLLALRGVLEMPTPEEDSDLARELEEAVLACLDDGLAALESARREEGAALVPVLLDRVARIEELTLAIEADPSRSPEHVRERLSQTIQPLLATAQLDENRLMQEAAMLATRADIREEIDRLKTHVASARQLLAKDGPVGRRLDFLAQEFNRETNTICSKSGAASITAAGLEMKAVVDQFREQVQNLE